MKRWVRIIITTFVLLLLFCAKKMLPPSPDRFPPRLIEVNARSRVQLELIFDEAIDPARFNVESLNISGLTIRGVSMGREQNRVLVWTEPQQAKNYLIKGLVWDVSGNPGRFRGGFQGSSRIDTIAPRVVGVMPVPETGGLYRSIRIGVRFSEPVDTMVRLTYLLVPGAVESLFVRSWEPNWQEVRFVCRESLPGQEFYFLLCAGVVDLEKNRCRMPAYTYWTADSVFLGRRIRGRAYIGKKPVVAGVVFFNQQETRAIAPILSDGSWEIKVRTGVYNVFGVGDTNFDRFADLISQEVEFNTAEESLNLFFMPETMARGINEYRR